MDFERFFNPDFLAAHPGATLVYHAPLTQTRVWRVRDGDLNVAVKVSRYEGLRRRFRWLRHGTPAQREYRSAAILAQAGIPTAEPLAYRCRRSFGLPRESVLVVRWIADAPSIYRQPGSPALRQAAADFAVRLFRAGVYPGDLNPGNLLARAAKRQAGGTTLRPSETSPQSSEASPFEIFLIDQVEVDRDQPLQPWRMAKCLGRFYLRASCADSWGPWAALKWLAAVIRGLDLPLAEQRRLWRQTIFQAQVRQAALRRRYVQQADREPPTPARPVVRKEVLGPEQLSHVVASLPTNAQCPITNAPSWQTVHCDGQDWLVLATADPDAAKAAWLRLMILWNLLVVAPRPGTWVVEGDRSLVVAQNPSPCQGAVAQNPSPSQGVVAQNPSPCQGAVSQNPSTCHGVVAQNPSPFEGEGRVRVDLATALQQATDATRRQLSWQLARLIVRLRLAGASISAEDAGRLVVLGQAGRITGVGFDRDVAVTSGRRGRLDDWVGRLSELGGPIDAAFRRQLVADLRRARRLARWAMV